MVIILSIVASIASIALVAVAINSYYVLNHRKVLISKKSYKKRYADGKK